MSNKRFWKRPSAETVSDRKAALFNNNPGLREALQVKHRIIADIGNRLDTWGKLTDPQIATIIKIAKDQTDRKAAQDAEVKVEAPEGKVQFTGRVVSLKERATYHAYGQSTWKITVKIENGAGVWLCWLTCPVAVFDAQERKRKAVQCAAEQSSRQVGTDDNPKIVGAVVTLSATLTRGDDKHFAFGKRPKLIEVEAWGGRSFQGTKSVTAAAA